MTKQRQLSCDLIWGLGVVFLIIGMIIDYGGGKMAAEKKKSRKSNNMNKSKKTMNKNLSNKLSSQEQKIKSQNQVFATLLFAVAILLFCIIVIPGEKVWYWVHSFVLGLFSISSVLWPMIMGYIAVRTTFERPISKMAKRMCLCTSFIITFSTFIYLVRTKENINNNYFTELKHLYEQGTHYVGSGLIGGILGFPFARLMGLVGSRIFVGVMLAVLLMLLTEINLAQVFSFILKLFTFKRKNQDDSNDKKEQSLPEHPVCSNAMSLETIKSNEKLERLKKAYGVDEEKNDCLDDNEEDSVQMAAQAFVEKQKKNKKQDLTSQEINTNRDEAGNYKFPPVDLLEKSKAVDEGNITDELQHSGQMLVDTLKSFNVQTKIIDISRGPAVTRYELQPASGVKISKITNLADDIALNLAAYGVRIEAPIPGKAAVGIEVPNKMISVVTMRELIESREFRTNKSKLSVILGKDISGNVQLADIARMPHLLIAGSTGSGKSVCINSFIISMLYNATPDEVRLLMIDPKVVELGIYNGIPHLLVPVVTDPRKAAGALNWAVSEMLNRYKIFADCNVRDLVSYNRMVAEKKKSGETTSDDEELKPMPQIVIIIDELADLMMAAPNEVEDAICRLAQMARAAGMHLVIATQRPSVDVITGIIKANIPSRIALAVSSQVDSRTILDMSGAEKLLGRGDMLFAPVGASKPMRVQGCYVTDREIESVIDFIKKSQESEYDQEIIEQIEKNAAAGGEKSISGSDDVDDNKDPMLQEAIKCVVEAGQASTSLLQRRLRLGYARAGRLIDEMEQMGVVGPHEGSKPRQVLISQRQLLEMNMQKAD